MSFLFWTSIVLILYPCVGYPLAIFFAAQFFSKPVSKDALEPSVSVVLSAYNEERYIEKKIISLLNLDYPEEKIEILVGSDGSTDQTDAIVSKFHSPRVRLTKFVKNSGKPQVLNALVKEAKGEILLFTDARQELDREAVRALVQNFSDSHVGCVSGELLFYEGTEAAIGRGMGTYWNYEKFLRKKESEVSSMLGATGAIYAIRRHLFTEVPPEMLVDDMYIPLAIVRKGYRAIFESQAKAYDQASEKGRQEFKRKVRTLVGNYQIFQAFPELFNPRKSPVAFQLFSHKLLRLMVPFFLMTAFTSNLFLLGNPLFRFTFVVQVLFYMLALVGTFHDQVEPSSAKRGILKRAGLLAYTFCLLNYSAFVALFQFLRGNHKSVWKKAYV